MILFEAVFGQQLQFVVAHQRVALNQRMTDRADVLLEPGTGQFTRGNAAARLVFAFDDQRLYARFGEIAADDQRIVASARDRSEEHTSELQSLMRISYAVFCLKKKKTTK